MDHIVSQQKHIAIRNSHRHEAALLHLPRTTRGLLAVVREVLAPRTPAAMSPGRFAVLVLALSLTLLPHLAWAAIVNRTIDDSSGDPITGTRPEFLPNISTWNDHTCAGCRIQPDVNRAFGNSWHETTYNPQRGRQSIVIPFNGEYIPYEYLSASHE